MNEHFRSLKPSEVIDAFRLLPAEFLRTVFDLSDDEIRVGMSNAACNGEKTIGETDARQESTFAEFLKTEYNNIASAHFNTNTTITQFFQFYLLILGVPITVAGILVRFAGDKLDVTRAAFSYGGLIPIVVGCTAAVGMFMMAYLVMLRLDSLLYARTVNGIRQFFFGRSDIDLGCELAMRALPRTTAQPRLFEPRFFGSVVMTFALLDTLYYGISMWMTLKMFGVVSPGVYYFLLCTAVASVCVHFGIYYALCEYRETHYLRTHRVGIDIDGVLNDHRHTFCDLLAKEVGKEVNPESISRIPVHECGELRTPDGRAVTVCEKDEHSVFNRIEYWRNLRPAKDAARVVRELKETMNFEIVIFTYRPWPNPVQYEQVCDGNGDSWQAFRREWSGAGFLSWHPPVTGTGRWTPEFVQTWINRLLERCRTWAMTRITKEWLNDFGVPYDQLVVERGNVHVANPRGKVRNRFRVSARREIRVFIEDELDKAKKLARICEVVYLLDQPYNRCNDKSELPNNVVRVASWDEILRHVRKHL